MRIFPLILIFLLTFTNVAAQVDLVGKWRINTLVGLVETNEYKLTKSDDLHIYGNSIGLDSNNRFVSSYSAWCGNDCFTTNQGGYKIIDETHINFYLEQVNIDGDCENKLIHPNIDIGTFFIVKDSSSIRLIRSNLDSKIDSINLDYSNQVEQFDQETSKVFNLNFISMRPSSGISDIELVKDCVGDNPDFDLSQIEILFSKRIRGDHFKIILFKYKKSNFISVVDVYHNNVGLFDPKSIPD